MGTETGIEWCHHTFNAWRGCTKVSDGCKFCYADRDSKRNPKVLGVWGPNGTRVIAAEAYWQQPIKWNQAAREAGERRHVFCASLADVYEGRDTMPEPSWGPVEAAGKRLLKVIHRTPWLDWLLLTKRPQNIMSLTQAALDPEDLTVAGDPVGDGLLSASFKELFPTVWLGTSVENQEAVHRVHELMKVRAAQRPAGGFVHHQARRGRFLRRSIDPAVFPGTGGLGVRRLPGPRRTDWRRHSCTPASRLWSLARDCSISMPRRP